jgi:hypothetical protein
VINSFRDKETKRISDGEISKKFPIVIQKLLRVCEKREINLVFTIFSL